MVTMNNLSDPRSGGRVFCGQTGRELDPVTLAPLVAAPEPIAPTPPPAPIPTPEPEPIPEPEAEDPELEESEP